MIHRSYMCNLGYGGGLTKLVSLVLGGLSKPVSFLLEDWGLYGTEVGRLVEEWWNESANFMNSDRAVLKGAVLYCIFWLRIVRNGMIVKGLQMLPTSFIKGSSFGNDVVLELQRGSNSFCITDCSFDGFVCELCYCVVQANFRLFYGCGWFLLLAEQDPESVAACDNSKITKIRFGLKT
ncbi:hypothetical protein VNO80_24529 [Phaseolus coccineus]|uniref:Uncharacterized protein n=1 Tax=Phaseolus coccineus TaxID=3886 RepID=A0AAN9LT26_PHACN